MWESKSFHFLKGLGQVRNTSSCELVFPLGDLNYWFQPFLTIHRVPKSL